MCTLYRLIFSKILYWSFISYISILKEFFLNKFIRTLVVVSEIRSNVTEDDAVYGN